MLACLCGAPLLEDQAGEASSLILKSLSTSPWPDFLFTRAFKGIAAKSELDQPLLAARGSRADGGKTTVSYTFGGGS